MDFSGGVSDKRDIYIDYVSILIRSLDLNRTAVHVAAIYYSGPKRARTLFHLRKHSRAENAIKDLQRAPSNGGTTRTGEAIYYATNEFNEKFGARKDARKMIIIFTDGHSQVLIRLYFLSCTFLDLVTLIYYHRLPLTSFFIAPSSFFKSCCSQLHNF
ncbi:unnamed protein product [Brugia pahangi]|uniref:VWFA domain-containing protein n=1 Tax=Brugia pahangi TaxID=6280 RepID=A0A0N4TFC6_BRUPA|nr:unnamed protein product [Brugia pahangi]